MQKQSVRLLWGRVRRFYLCHFRPSYVKMKYQQRHGQCLRCGACCHMGLRCPSLIYQDDGTSLCARYGKWRSMNCKNFPIDERDIADRDIVQPNKPCGFSFDNHSE